MSHFEVLPGLPGTGPLPEQFSASGFGTHSEGFVVRVEPDGGTPWVGNFQPGITRCCGVYRHPDGRHLVVVSSGQGYQIDPATRGLVALVGGGGIESVHVHDAFALLVLDLQHLAFFAIGRSGRDWHSKRLSWDGFRNLEIGAGEIVGEGWDVMDERWEPFTVDLRTGASSGGAYHWDIAESWEQLAAEPDAG